ncbi:MAG TPA: hypothetical protein VID27_16600 [Blastocatellia bacterium]|jgi:hypothetical protein
MSRKKLFSLTAIITLIGILPIISNAQKRSRNKVIVPAWRIQVIDEAGNPVKGAFVRQVWQDYDIEDEGHEEDASSDENGYVSFPGRRGKVVSESVRARKRLKNICELGVHASFGVHAYILAYGKIVGCKRLEGSADYEEGKPLPKQLQMRMVTLPGFKCEP